jgi:ERF superfamily
MNAPLAATEATLHAVPSGGSLTPGPTSEVVAFLAMIERAARDPSFDLDKLDRLLAVREREHARLAEQVFNAALAEVQTEMQPVAADSDNPQTRSRYASYAALDRAVRPVYTRHGFGLSFNTADANGPEQARIVCDVCHAGGHTRRYHIDMPVDGKGARGGDVMTKTHAMGSGVSSGMRYLLKMIFNLAIDHDDDGNAAGGRAKPERPRTVMPAPNHALEQGGIADRAMVARAAQAWEPKPPKVFRASEAGHLDEPPPHDFIPDGPVEATAKALNRRLHPMNDELPAHSAPPKPGLDHTDINGTPAFLRRTRDTPTEPTYVDLVGGANG